jgi:hypothetical protein
MAFRCLIKHSKKPPGPHWHKAWWGHNDFIFCATLLRTSSQTSLINRNVTWPGLKWNVRHERSVLWFWIGETTNDAFAVVFHSADGPKCENVGRYFVDAGVSDNLSKKPKLACKLWLQAIDHFVSINGIKSGQVSLWFEDICDPDLAKPPCSSRPALPKAGDLIFDTHSEIIKSFGPCVADPYPGNIRWPLEMHTAPYDP